MPGEQQGRVECPAALERRDLLGPGIGRMAVLGVRDPQRHGQVGRDDDAPLLVEQDELRRRVARSRDDAPGSARRRDRVAVEQQPVRKRSLVVAVVPRGEQRRRGALRRDARPAHELPAPFDGYDRVAQDVGDGERPRRERELALRPLLHRRREPVVIRMGVGAHEESDRASARRPPARARARARPTRGRARCRSRRGSDRRRPRGGSS